MINNASSQLYLPKTASKKERILRRAFRSLSFHLDAASRRLDFLLLDRCLKAAGVANADTIPTYTTKRELHALYLLATSCPTGAVALEIGSYLGISCCYLAAGLMRVEGDLICVDTWQNETMPEGVQDTFAMFKNNIAAVEHLVTPIQKRSEELTDANISQPLHLVFLDGDHSYKAVNGDFHKVAPHIVEDGMLAFHDAISFSGVSRTIGEALGSGEWQLAGLVDNLVWLTKTKPPK